MAEIHNLNLYRQQDQRAREAELQKIFQDNRDNPLHRTILDLVDCLLEQAKTALVQVPADQWAVCQGKAQAYSELKKVLTRQALPIIGAGE